MIIRVTMRKSGLAEYLMYGKRADSPYLREERDSVMPLYGSLDLLKNAEDYLNKEKHWNSNYEHITVSFSEDDMKALGKLSDLEYRQTLEDISIEMIKHRTSGYDLENEVIAYAELHSPKIQVEEKHFKDGTEKKRLPHIHIGISYLNPLSDTKLMTTFFDKKNGRGLFINKTISEYIATKHGLKYATEKPKPNKLNRRILIDGLKQIESKKELHKYLDEHNIKYGYTNKNSETKQSNIYVYDSKGGKIHLRGKDFPHIEIMHNDKLDDSTKAKLIRDIHIKRIEESKSILDDYYKKQRYPNIGKRRSEKTKTALNDIYKELEEEKTNNTENTLSIGSSYKEYQTLQEKIFFKHYRTVLGSSLHKFYVEEKRDGKVNFRNKAKGINVTDLGNLITAKGGQNLEETVTFMLDLAVAKGWDITKIKPRGSDEFIKETYRQIAKRTRPQIEEMLKKKALYEPKIKRPTTVLQHLKKEIDEKNEITNKFTSEEIADLKKNLSNEVVLAYASEKYKLDISQYELAVDNKINNKSNRQKPKNVIDFLQKEVNLTTKEAIELCHSLLHKKIKLNKKENYNEQDRTIFHKPDDKENRREPTTRNDMRTLSDSDMVHSGRLRDRSVLSENERNRLWEKTKTDNGLFGARDRRSEDESEKGSRTREGAVENGRHKRDSGATRAEITGVGAEIARVREATAERTGDRIAYGLSLYKKDGTIHYEQIEKVVGEIIETAKNDKELEERLADTFSSQKVKFQTFDETIVFINKNEKETKIELEKIHFSKDEIIKKMRENRGDDGNDGKGQKPKKKRRRQRIRR